MADLLARDDQVLFVDVREHWEYDIAHLDGSILIPLGNIPGNLQRIENSDQVAIFCHQGMRSLDAAAWLRPQGVAGARSMTGGNRALLHGNRSNGSEVRRDLP